jgi:outer membrane protein assembly factor BamB
VGLNSRLAVWPLLLLSALYASGYWLPAALEWPIAAGFFTTVIGGGVFLLLFFGYWLSRRSISRRERWLTFGALLLTLTVSVALSHPSMGVMMVVIYGLPVVCMAWGAALWLSNFLPAGRRMAVGIGVFVLLFGALDLLRSDGIDGNQRPSLHFRWTPTNEDLYQASRQGKASPTPDDKLAPLMAVAGDWTQFRGPNREGAVRGVKLDLDWTNHPPKLIWKQRIGPAWSSMIVVGDHLFTQEQRGDIEAVVCLNTATGAELWSHEDRARFFDGQAGAGPRATPTFQDGKLYTLGATGLLHCFEAANGKLDWTADISAESGAPQRMWGYASSPLVAAGIVIVHAGGKDDKGVLAYQADSGKLVWSFAAGNMSYSSPQLIEFDGQQQVLFFGDQGLNAVDPQTGTALWTYAAPGKSWRATQPRRLGPMQVYFGSEDLGSVVLDLHHEQGTWSATRSWSSKALRPAYNDVVVHDGSIYGFDNDRLCCIRAADGKRQWKDGRFGHGQLLLLADQPALLVVSEQGELALIACNPEQFQELGRLPAIEGKTWNHPTFAHGRLYVRNDSEIACFEPKRLDEEMASR